MKKILYIATGDNNGSSLALLSLIDSLDDKIIPYVIYSREAGLKAELDKRGIESICIYMQPNAYPPTNGLKNKLVFVRELLKGLILYRRGLKKVYEIVEKIKPDIIHTNVGIYHQGFEIAKKKHIPHVWHIREFQDLDFDIKILWTKKRFIKKLNSPFNRNITITKCVAFHFGLDVSTVIYDGVCDENLPSIEFKKQNIFLFVGSISEKKGTGLLVSSFLEFCKFHDNVKLLIVGSDNNEYVYKLKQKISKSKYSDNIKFLGYRKDRLQLMHSSKAIIVPSISEGFGLITAEAMSQGCFVIGRNCAGTKEQFDNAFEDVEYDVGLRFMTKDELIDRMKQVLTMPFKEYNRKIIAAKKVVLGRYSIKNNANKILKIYNEL